MKKLLRLALVLSILAAANSSAEPDYRHGYAFLSKPAYPEDFLHFDYVNPEAPRGGRIRVAEMGNWDNFNPIAERGRLAGGLGFWSRDRNLLWDCLMVPSLDEPATYYGLLAEGIAVADDGAWVQFKLREEARWHDGRPITVDDVVFSFNAIKEHADPATRTTFRPFAIEVAGPREIRFLVHPAYRDDPAVPIRLSAFPVLPNHYWEERDISKTTVEPPPGSGPYRIGNYVIGRSVEFERVPDYWAKDLPVNRGRFNFDRIKYDYFRDDQVQTEALKAHVIDVHVENVPGTWHSSYDVPAVNDGYLKKVELKLARPAGLWWPIFWNMAQPRFQDIRVRKAFWLLNDMEWFNKRAYGYWGHATSFFHDSELAATGLPGPRELELLGPLRGLIPETVFTRPYTRPPNEGPGWSRENLLMADKLLKEAGWIVEDGRRIHRETREPFHIRFVAVSPALGGSFIPFTRLLEHLGITSSIKSPEISNWLYRMQSGDFDAGAVWFLPDYTPTLTIKNAFHSSEANKTYSANWSNLQDPAIDALIADIAAAGSWDDYVAAIRAFDRVMLHNYYWIPMMSKTKHAVAWWDKFGIPDHGKLKRLAHVDIWWWDDEKAKEVGVYTGGDH